MPRFGRCSRHRERPEALAAAVAPGIADLLLEVGAVLFVARASSAVSLAVLALSPVPLYLLAGLVLGEGGAVALDASTGFLAVGAELGLILLLLTLGLEFSADEFASVLRRHVPSGVVDLLLNADTGGRRRVAAPRLVDRRRW